MVEVLIANNNLGQHLLGLFDYLLSGRRNFPTVHLTLLLLYLGMVALGTGEFRLYIRLTVGWGFGGFVRVVFEYWNHNTVQGSV